MQLGKAAAKALVWTALESFTLSGLSLISLLVFARLITKDDFGVVAIALAIVQLLSLPVDLLFHDALIQRADLEPIHVNSAFTFSVLLSAFFCGACWLFADVAAGVIGEPAVANPLRYMSLSLLGSGFGAVLVAMQRRKLEFRALAVRSVAGRAISAITAITMAALGAGLWALVVQQVLLVCLATLVLWWLAEERPRFELRWAPTYELLRFGVLATAGQLVAIAIPRTFMVLVGSYLGSESAGLISLTFRGVDMLRDLLAQAVGHVALPLLTRLRDDKNALFDAYNRSVGLTALVTFPLFVGLAACAEEVVVVAFGERWLTAAPYFSTVALMALATFTRMYGPALLQTLGMPGFDTIALIAQEACILVGMVWFGRMSTAHAMGVWAGSLLLTMPIDMLLQRRMSGMGVLRQLRGAGLPLLASLLMAAAVAAVKSVLPHGWPPALRLLPMVASGGLCYLVLIALLDREGVRTFLGFVRQSLRRGET